MDWELIWWCVAGVVGLIGAILIYNSDRPNSERKEDITILRIGK